MSPVDVAVANKVVNLLFAIIIINSRVRFEVALTAPLTPSVADMVNVKVPALFVSVLGVIVNTPSVFETVAIEPNPDVA